MRISSKMLQQNALQTVRRNLEALARAQSAVTTGKRINTVSDDPANAATLMRLDAGLRDVAQFQRNGTMATTRLSVEDASLSSLRTLLAQAREIGLGAATPLPSDPARQPALAALGQIRDQIISLGNTRVGEEYLFGGAQTATPPFDSAGNYVGDTTIRQVQLDDGVMMDTTHTGDQLFLPGIQAIDALIQEVQAGAGSAVAAAAIGIDAPAQQALATQSVNGVRLAQIQSTARDLASRAATSLDNREAIADVNPAEAAVRLISLQNSMEQAYAALGRVLSTNLLDYLRA